MVSPETWNSLFEGQHLRVQYWWFLILFFVWNKCDSFHAVRVLYALLLWPLVVRIQFSSLSLRFHFRMNRSHNFNLKKELNGPFRVQIRDK